ncbi:MAG: hypothetical protein ABSF21_00180 [Dehalococcoidia bacterium]|jgi:hypothetical protein
MKEIWIRRDRNDGEEEEITKGAAKARLIGFYHRINVAMAHASRQVPLTTGYADYYPKEEKKEG